MEEKNNQKSTEKSEYRLCGKILSELHS